jgi:hypothetical protein
MSAYLCNPTHIGILAQRIAFKTTTWGNAPTVAAKLATENLKSVAYRYSKSEDQAAQEFISMPSQAYIDQCKVEADNPDHLTRVPVTRLIGMVNCSEYQSCEHPEWATSEARDMMIFLLKAAINSHLDAKGIDKGWEWEGK